MTADSPSSLPLYVMLKPAGAACNLKCDYCYYLEKAAMYPDHKRYQMSDEILELFVKQYFAAQQGPDVLFIWHGGEALLRDMSFYKKALVLQNKYGAGFRVQNSIQTNGVLLSDDWCRFFRDNNFLVGLSLDGPEHCHDRYRRYSDNKASFSQVMRGLTALQKYGADYNILCAVNDYNSRFPLETYEFFKSSGSYHIQYIPIVERRENILMPYSVRAEAWGDYLTAIFDHWVRQDVGKVFVQQFDSGLYSWMNLNPPLCVFAKSCGHAAALEFNGDLFSCDHFVNDEYKLGNIKSGDLAEMMGSERQRTFGDLKHNSLPQQCLDCRFKFACYGECPRNRFLQSSLGEAGLNYLCGGYLRYFEHIEPYMNFMKAELENGGSPTNIMQAVISGSFT